jgi:hypothetical protein
MRGGEWCGALDSGECSLRLIAVLAGAGLEQSRSPYDDMGVSREQSGFTLWPVEADGVPGPQMRGTGGTLIYGETGILGSRPPACSCWDGESGAIESSFRRHGRLRGPITINPGPLRWWSPRSQKRAPDLGSPCLKCFDHFIESTLGIVVGCCLGRVSANFQV